MLKIPRPIRFAIFLLLLAGIVVLVVFGVKRFFLSAPKTVSEGALAPVAPGESVWAFGDGYIASDNIRIRCYNSRGEMQWDYGADSQERSFACSSTTIALWRDNSLHLLDAAGVVKYNKTQNGTIDIVRCGVQRAGIYIPGAEKELLIINRDTGETVDEISLAGRMVLDFGFYTEQDSLWIMLLDSSGVTPVTYLSTYKPGVSENGFYRFDQIIYKTLYSQSGLTVIGSRDVSAIDPAGDITQGKNMVYGWQYIDHYEGRDGESLLFSLAGEAAGGQPSRLLLVQGDTSTEMHLPSGCISAVVSSKYVYGIAPNAIYALALDGSSSTSYEMPNPITAVIAKLTQNRLLVETGQETRVITLPG